MNRKALVIFICFVFLICAFGCSETPVVSEKNESQSSTNSECSSVEEENTGALTEEEITAKAIWQDPNNIVLIWNSGENYEYSIYRSNHQNSDFEYIGKTKTGSYRDDTASYPSEYYYKIKAKDLKIKIDNLNKEDRKWKLIQKKYPLWLNACDVLKKIRPEYEKAKKALADAEKEVLKAIIEKIPLKDLKKGYSSSYPIEKEKRNMKEQLKNMKDKLKTDIENGSLQLQYADKTYNQFAIKALKQ